MYVYREGHMPSTDQSLIEEQGGVDIRQLKALSAKTIAMKCMLTGLFRTSARQKRTAERRRVFGVLF